MSTRADIIAYASQQRRYHWRRALMRGLIRTVGFHLLGQVQIDGAENIPRTGPTILMMSHIALIDPVVCLGAVKERYVIPMTKIENARDPFFGLLVRAWGAYTVDRTIADRSALLTSIELLKQGEMILIAPEGTRSPDGLTEPKGGLAYIATKANAVILPTAMTGGTDYLQRWKHLRRVHTRVTFGRPFRFKTSGRSRIPREEQERMTQEAMYQLALTQPDPSLRGVYSDIDRTTTDTLDFVTL